MMKTFRGFLTAVLLCCMAVAFYGCGDSGSTDTVWITGSGDLFLKGTVETEDGGLREGVPVLLTQNGVVVAQDITDENGKYAFYALPPGTYTLEATLTGYEAYSMPITLDASRTFNIILRLPPPTYELEGTVEDAEGNPLEGVAVTASMPGSEMQQATTDADGAFVIYGLPAGTYAVEASLEGYAPYSEDVTVPADAPLEIVLAAAFDITGTAGVTADIPLAGALVELTPDVPVRAPVAVTATVAADGSFTLEDVEEGSYTLNIYSDEAMETLIYSAAEPVEVDGTLADITVVLSDADAADVKVPVVYGNLTYTPDGGSETPAAGAEVTLTQTGATPASLTATADAQGNYYILNAAAQASTVTATVSVGGVTYTLADDPVDVSAGGMVNHDMILVEEP